MPTLCPGKSFAVGRCPAGRSATGTAVCVTIRLRGWSSWRCRTTSMNGSGSSTSGYWPRGRSRPSWVRALRGSGWPCCTSRSPTWSLVKARRLWCSLAIARPASQCSPVCSRAGHDLGVVWFDAHADFHTEATTTSGYLGGMPLALAAGVGTPTLPDLLGLRPVPESQILLVDARDTDPGEHVLLAVRAPRRRCLRPAARPGLLYPVTGGPSVQAVLDAVTLILATGRVAAVGVAATWHHERQDATAHQEFLRHVLQVTQFVDGPG